MNSAWSRDRIRISKDNASVIASLGERTDAARVFQNLAKAAAFAASVGYHFNKFEPVTGPTERAVLFPQLDQSTDLGADLVAVLALARAEDISILEPDIEERAELDPVLIFEGYVNGGLSYIRRQEFDPAQPIKAVRNLVRALNPDRSDFLSRS